VEFKIAEFNTATAKKLAGLAASRHSVSSKWLDDPDSPYAPPFAVIAFDGNQPVGWCGIGTTRGRNSMPVISIFVLPDFRKDGVGERLARSCLEEFKLYDEDGIVVAYSADGWRKLGRLIEEAGFESHNLDSSPG